MAAADGGAWGAERGVAGASEEAVAAEPGSKFERPESALSRRCRRLRRQPPGGASESRCARPEAPLLTGK